MSRYVYSITSVFTGIYKRGYENDQYNKNENVGDVSFGIDNHFQLLLYMSENDCQLEIQIFQFF